MDFIKEHLGEFAALLTAISWTITALANENASKRIGSISLNLIRLFIGFMFLSAYGLIARGRLFPSDADGYNWLWLSLSGFAGFVFGDLFLFKAYAVIGSRFSMLMMTLVPPITALLSFFMIDERLTLLHFVGMTLTFSGIAIAIFSREAKGEKLTLKLAPYGILLALGGALGQASGLVLSKIGMRDYDPFAATQIRVIAGFAGFAVLVTVLNRWKSIKTSIGDKSAMTSVTIGSFFGPFLGVSFSLMAVKLTEAGIASTIMSLVPVFIILPAIFIYKQKVTLAEVIGSVVSVGGVALFFI